jgi:CRISPR-associated endonuclease/helicase Cas3
VIRVEYSLISHPLDPPLKLFEHLSQVSTVSHYLISQKHLNFQGLSKKEICELCEITAVCHDFAKSSSFFQKYILSKVNNTRYEGSDDEKSHAFLSAFFGWHMVENWLSEERNSHIEPRWRMFLPLAVFLAIEGHHGRYKSIEEIRKEYDKKSDLLILQLQNINPEFFNYIILGVNTSQGKEFNEESINSIGSKIRKLHRKYPDFDSHNTAELSKYVEQRILALLLYSILLESDKAYLASDNPDQYERNAIDIPTDLVDKYLNNFDKKGVINEERIRAYQQTIGKISSFPLNERLHSITLPTGLGKTLLSASWALKLRERIRQEEGFTPKIIVALPFLSIIEQTDAEYKKFLSGLYEIHKDRLYMSRYSIADFEYKDGIDDNERSDNSIDFFLNIWNSEIIVSTFDQLLYSMFSLKSKPLMRFHNIFNAIIVFDEIQALPSELWKPFEYFFRILSDVGKTHVVLMSATQTGFFPGVVERVPNPTNYFETRKRVKLQIKPEKIALDLFSENLPELLKKYSDHSIMFVMNTRDSSKFVHKKIRDLKKDGVIESRPLIYLSSYVTPSERSKRVCTIKETVKKNQNPVIVTTQCIEAGVDIDVDFIIRDRAPLDSIFQVCGRCNRNGEKNESVVEIITLINEKGREFSPMIYDDILLEQTNRCLTSQLEIPERDFYKIGTLYFSLVQQKLNQSMKVVTAYANYSHCIDPDTKNEKVNIKKLLRDDEHQEQFIVSSLDEALPLEIRKALAIKDRWERRYGMKRLGKRIASCSINVRFGPWIKMQPEDLQINNSDEPFRILNEQLYDKDGVGFDIDLMNSISHTMIC